MTEYSKAELVRASEKHFDEICRVMKAHRQDTRVSYALEPDLLRAAGPLKHLGLALGAYVGKGYDCKSEFRFLDYPTYEIPIEIKKKSSDFRYQQRKYGKDELARAVVLCAHHEHKTMPSHIDVIELSTLAAKFCNIGYSQHSPVDSGG